MNKDKESNITPKAGQDQQNLDPNYASTSSTYILNNSEFEDVPNFDRTKAEDLIEATAEDEVLNDDDSDYLPAWDGLREPAGSTQCGIENRVRIGNTAEFPWSAICHLIISRNGKGYLGTGYFVSPNTVLTAGHCIYNKKSGGRSTSIKVVPGRDGNVRPFGSVISTEFAVSPEWDARHAQEFDYGIIKVPGDFGIRTGWFEVANLPELTLENVRLNTAGYPGDMKPASGMHFNAGAAKDVLMQRIYYMLDTYFGASGSPVWIKTPDGKRIAVGIHNYGGCPNKCTRINERVLSDIRRWIEL